ncbi:MULTISPECIES: aminotransferase class III-fold pyridoxal phosphate-dependent enzyme [unclassified Pseudomonas]|uniref:aminotransferase class III-fold pyridoxal phosphate-dependent enzyme n=1 Tax=unclassified Pseudomonas TaxID=196821 RepID=UPI000BD60D29|nr:MULTISPECIES: aminotransferase class III-fold pyridoxal phosphate-dependent enzyme [unclassified Pseudomonas]PVZ11392.1 putrescine aminotransferase [Pseudomonas sp. URIL14HWK12:I12]PVZ22390.1 putrescine aminotransferase [Pseudomonas sp. URIL14HWK12:I10]PVZ31486.1 putrescine aminotransferase [Pseudomonas sp. URIL14HWK12:I11]SNZ16439.1 ornithine--oxo-acid transaminase [Pseudomonas sp. URIL14HWK12:I9]
MNSPLALERYQALVNPHWASLLQQLGQAPVFLRAKGEFLYDSEGKRWLDFVGHYGASILGHNHEAIQHQLIELVRQDLPVGAPLGICTGAAPLAERLIDRIELPGSWKLCTLTTGTEAVEGAVKAALFHTSRRKLLVRRRCFHGNSALTLHLSDQPAHRVGFETLRPDLEVVFFEEIDQALALIAGEDIAALLIEPVQAMGGGRACPASEADRLLKACRAFGTVSIVDEVFSGLGRCGAYSAMQALGWRERPDMLLLAKALTGGLIPSAHLLLRTPLFDDLFARPGCQKILGSTFANNNLALHLASAVLDLLDEHLGPGNALEPLECFGGQLGACAGSCPDVIQKVTGLAACVFIHCKDAETCFNLWHSLFLNQVCTTICPHDPAVLKLIVPLTVSQDSLDEFVHIFSDLTLDLQG